MLNMEHFCIYCGAIANYQFKNGNWCCHKFSSQCPKIKNKNSQSCKKSDIKLKLIQHYQNLKILKIQEYNKNPKYCLYCNKFFSYEERFKKFCNNSCAASFNNKNRNFSKEKQKSINLKIQKTLKEKQKLKEKNNKEKKYCIICHKEIPVNKKRKTCGIICEKELKKLHQAHVGGGYRKGSSRGKHGYYKGIWCDSTYELAFLIYCLDHNINIKRCTDVFEYELNGKKHKYHPDFIINDEIIEIKNYYRKETDIKINAVKKLNRKIKVLYYEDLIEIFNYISITYNKTINKRKNNIYELYDLNK